MSELVTWLWAQLDEDERVAQAAAYYDMIRIESATYAEEDHARRHDPARVLREVSAKRRILDQLDEVRGYEDRIDGEWGTGRWPEDHPDRASVQIVRLLALPYAARPGYRDEWRPDTPQVNPGS